MTHSRRANRSQAHLLAVSLAVFALLFGAYFSLRFGGLSMEVDASRQANSAQGIMQSGRLINPGLYNHGFGYGVQLAFMSLTSGLPVQTLQISSSLWVFILALVAFITYRELLTSNATAGLAVVLLFIQPDFLFYILRGSHERNTWAFALLLVFLLARSYRYLQFPGKLAVYIGLFYLVFWAFLSSNVYFAATFMSAMMFSFIGGWVLNKVSGRKRDYQESRSAALQRIIIISLICFVLLYVFINYSYKPALQIYELLTTMTDRVSLMVLGTQQAETPVSYQYFSQTWRSQQAYLALTGVQWMISVVSLIAWGMGLKKLAEMDQNSWLLWLMYSSFGVLMVIGVIADYAGFLSSNLQLRMFTPFTIFSSAMAAGLFLQAIRSLRNQWKTVVVGALAVMIIYGAVAAVLKVTNDPLFGNQWLFYSPSELAPRTWMEQAKIPQDQVWLEISDRLVWDYYFWQGSHPVVQEQYSWGWTSSPLPYTVISELTRLRANRSGISLPETSDQNRIYDNGRVQVYHRRSLTPYEP